MLSWQRHKHFQPEEKDNKNKIDDSTATLIKRNVLLRSHSEAQSTWPTKEVSTLLQNIEPVILI